MISRIFQKLPLISNRTKLLISTTLLLIAFITCILCPENLDHKICLLAMFFSFVGDIALNCTPREKRPHSLLYLGAFFFMISHIAYASAYYWIIKQTLAPFINFGSCFACVLMILIFIVSIKCIYISQKSLKPFMIFVFILYMIIISINFITIYSYSWSFHALSFIGATSFLISDYIIGIEIVFKIKSDTLRKLVWIFYPIGQILIILCR